MPADSRIPAPSCPTRDAKTRHPVGQNLLLPVGGKPLLSVHGLRVRLGGVDVVRGVSFDVHTGEVLALTGESGAGKSLTARALLGMLPREATTDGTVLLRGTAVTPADRGRRIAFVPQDALSALSPVHPVGEQIALALRSVQGLSRKDARSRAQRALAEVGITATASRAHPHELSGGMRQRAVIALATVNTPDLLIADEPTTSLDPATQDTVLTLLRERCTATGASLLLVTHALDAARSHADHIAVMYAGTLTEYGPTDHVLNRPLTPYTTALLASLPTADTPPRTRLATLPGRPPTPGETTAGCAFAPRCPQATDRCHTQQPEPRSLDNRIITCHNAALETP
ncbi:ABC transporter ATP-binding protein [Streptomyces exfoliatus]|uniref:ABC transporter ATP-binding protein n=1 Tax=Streptomyces exfoliatus TaxID=1905 RepID=UPI001FE22DCE|nr:ABC transporter ATP-binding protein [Streptomyces exfoliatus]